MSHKSEEQPKPVGTCPCGHELMLLDDRIMYHNCDLGEYQPFDLVKFAGILCGMEETEPEDKDENK